MLTTADAPATAAAAAGVAGYPEQRPRVLVVYGTRHGHTARIALRIAGQLKGAGYDVALSDVTDLVWRVPLDGLAGVVLGGSALRGRHPHTLRRFVSRHHDALNAMPTGFFSVGGFADIADPAERKAAFERMLRFLADTGWHPSTAAAFQGAIAYTRYPPLLRLAVRRAVAGRGGPTDVTRDHVLTDWEEVRRFADAFAVSLTPPRPRPIAHRLSEQPLWLPALAGAGACPGA